MKNEPLALPVDEACRMLGIGRTTFYSAVSKNQLCLKKFGRKSLIEMSELRRFIEQLPDK